MARANAVKLQADLSSITDSIGGFQAMHDSLKDPSYANDVMKVAHGKAEHEFNLLAAASAATGSIAHMYEWGTQGINRGRTNMRPNPMDPRARLWNEVWAGTGFSGTLSFLFRPSVAIVPKPTAEATGMTKRTLNKMSDHVFHWKALVMEMGQTVTIRPKTAKALLIPLKKGQASWANERDIRIGYKMVPGPIRVQPGREVAGNFTQFWTSFWEGYGAELLDKSIEEQVRSDFEVAIEVPGRGSNVLTPTKSVSASVQRRAKKIRQEAKVKAKTRTRVRRNAN